jgi:hypothetical protein
MKTELKRVCGTWYLVFPYKDDADVWGFLLTTILRRKRISFVNYLNGFKLI